MTASHPWLTSRFVGVPELEPGSGFRVHFMLYKLRCEEGKYLRNLRREKESFERLIKERGVGPVSR